MKATELRIGNLILRAPSSDYTEWKETTVNLTYLGLIWPECEDYKGIPLTEEWLQKFGFENHQAGFWRIKIHPDQNRYLQVPLSLREFWDVEIIIEKYRNENVELWIKGIHYVHELQNLYFALTGEELVLDSKATK